MNNQDERRGLPSASAMQRIILCPGSLRAEAGLPAENTPESVEGTTLHRYMESGINPYRLPNEEHQEVISKARKIEYETLDAVLHAPANTYEQETRLWSNNGAYSGKPDLLAIDYFGDCLILDYKFGRGDVEPAEVNEQLRALAALAYQNYPEIERVHVGIIQPRVSAKCDIVTYTREELQQACDYISKALERANREDAPRVPSEAACKYCKARYTCPELVTAMEVAKTAGKPARLDNWDALTPAQKGRRVWVAKLAYKAAKDVIDKAKTDMKAGAVIEGFELVEGKRKLEVVAPAEVCAALHGVLTPEEIVSICKLPIGELSHLYYRARKTEDEDATKKDCDASLRAALIEAGAAEYKQEDYQIKEGRNE